MLPKTVKNLIEKLAKLPEIGPRQATRLAFWLLKNKQISQDIAKDLKTISEDIKFCSNCFFILEGEGNLCSICRDKTRDRNILAVVEKETDLISLEQSGVFRGLYFILGQGEKVRSKEFISYLNNLRKQNILPKEILFALPPTSQADLIFEELKPVLQKFLLKVTRLARGLPRGSEIEFADSDTLSEALKGRK